MTEFVSLRPKTYSYLKDDGDSKKGTKGTKKCVIKRKLKFNDYKDCLLRNKTILRSQQIFKSENHDVFTQKVKKKALTNNDDGITTYPYGTGAGKVCKTELLSKIKKINDYINDK